MKLNDQKIKKIQPKDKPFKLSDGNGLYLYVLWRLKYRVDGKEKTLSIGTYPAVTLLQAREQAQIARQQHANGIDPSQAKEAQRKAALNTFQAVAHQWHSHNLESVFTKVIKYFYEQKTLSNGLNRCSMESD